MGSLIVRISADRLGSTVCTQAKADEGAEKSLRKRRRVRGKRFGKARPRRRVWRALFGRSRERHSREPGPKPAPTPKESKERRMNRSIRTIDHFYARVDQFDELIGKGSVMKRWGGSGRTRRSPLETIVLDSADDRLWYRLWKHRWGALHRHIIRFGEEVVWCSRIGPSFSYHMEQRFRLVFKFGPDQRVFTANIGLQDMLLNVGLRAQDRRRELANRRRSPHSDLSLNVSGGRNRACRLCGYFGPPPHQWNQCKGDLGWKSSVPQRGNKKKNYIARRY